MASCCVALTADVKYLFPAFVSAISARQNSSTEKADVIIFCLDLDEVTERLFGSICERENIKLLRLASDVIEGASAMMARLFLTRFVPATYQQFLYMDGDVLVTGSLDPLIDAHVPVGYFLAANDPLCFLLDDDTRQSRDLRAHLHNIGITGVRAKSYFNSGVLRIHRTGWEKTGEGAWECYSRNEAPSRFPDQDAINLAGGEHRLPMSLRWNYPVFLHNARLEKVINPRIHHFMSLPKPWHGSFAPWTSRKCEPYLSVIRRYPQIASFVHSMPIQKKIKYQLQQRAKQAIETFGWGFSARRDRVLAYERRCTSLSASSLNSAGIEPSVQF